MATSRRADMFTADGRPSDDDPREHGPRLGDERTALAEALRRQRLTLEMKCEGLDAEQMARRAVEPSTLSLLGLVRHLADVERGAFRETMAGQDAPRHYGSSDDRDGDFDGAIADDAVVAEAPSLDVTAGDPDNRHGTGGGDTSLREMMIGMIEEYARHMGHADILRERIDGRLGQ